MVDSTKYCFGNGCSRNGNRSDDTSREYTENMSIMNGSPKINELSENAILEKMTVSITTNNKEYAITTDSQKTVNVTIISMDYIACE